MKKRTLAFLTSLLLLLTACAGDPAAETGSPDPTSETDGEISAEAPEEQLDSLEARQLVDDGLSDKQWEGEEFRMICQNRYSEYQFV